MRRKACRRLMSMPRRDTMHRSSRTPAFLVILLFLVASVGVIAQQAQPQAQGQPQAQMQQLPVQDLSPPSDAELEKAALEAEKANAEASAAKGKPVNPNREEGYLFKQQVEEVVLYATVVDPKANRLVTGLDRNSFIVFEDGQPQKITSFRKEDIPVSVGIVIDNSGTMRDKRPAVNQAALNFVRASNRGDEVFLVNFDSEYYLDQDFTADVDKLKEALENLQSRGGTALYDAVIASADHLSKGAKLDKKVLLVVTDGEDTASIKSLEEAVAAVQKEGGPTIYAIGILDNEESGRQRKRAKRALERLAIETGGVAYFPSDLTEVDEITKAVAHDIRNQYAIGYKPARPQSEGGFRSVRVEARAGKNRLQVRTKSGYFAGAPNQNDKQAANSDR
jgi:Ca-activated chloride channel homolog